MRTNSHRIVLCHDTATGFAKVGWAADFPPGRFIHLDVVCESPDCHPITGNSPHYRHYQTACTRARELNDIELAKQIKTNQDRGWMAVPLHPASGKPAAPDEFGSYLKAAMRTLHRLTGNCQDVWVVVVSKAIVHIQSRRPARSYSELEYQVWKHHTLSELAGYSGETLEGRLVVQESGLWFVPAMI